VTYRELASLALVILDTGLGAALAAQALKRD
jgi:hypothetical protein